MDSVYSLKNTSMEILQVSFTCLHIGRRRIQKITKGINALVSLPTTQLIKKVTYIPDGMLPGGTHKGHWSLTLASTYFVFEVTIGVYLWEFLIPVGVIPKDIHITYPEYSNCSPSFLALVLFTLSRYVKRDRYNAPLSQYLFCLPPEGLNTSQDIAWLRHVWLGDTV